MVASTMPGTAKMILMSCAGSHGPNQPCAPNSSTKIRPATTGDTENGRSMRVISSCLPRKSNLAMAQAAATPNTRFSGTAIAADEQRQPDGAQRIGLDRAPPGRRPALAQRLGEHRDQRQQQEQREEAERQPISTSALTQTGSRVAVSPRSAPRRCAGAGRYAWRVAAIRLSSPTGVAVHRCSRLMTSSSTNEATSITDGDRRRAGVVVLLELGDDHQRRDLRHHRHVAGDEDHRAVLADRARERQREAGQQRRQQRRQDHPAERLPARRRPRLAAASSISASRSSSTGCTVRTTNGRPMKISATSTPSGVKATLMPSGSRYWPSQPFLRVERGQRDAGHRRRQRERQIDQRVDQLLAREAVAHQRPRPRGSRTPR